MDSSVNPPIFMPGERVAGRYRIVRMLGAGGAGQVYEAFDERLEERVALKTLHPAMLGRSDALERFRREIQLARRVTHPNVCRIYDVGDHTCTDRQRRLCGGAGEVLFLSMAFLKGETLHERIRRAGRLGPEEALPLARQMAEGLTAAHEVGIIHRDFKSSNILLVPVADDVRAVITDFGLARNVEPGSYDPNLTGSHVVMGTPAYMAPEQFSGGETTARTDVYGFGTVLYEMVTGTFPFRGANAIATAVQRLTQPPTPPRERVPELPAIWDAVLLRCLQVEPESRYASPAAAVEALEGRSGRPTGRPRPRLRARVLAAAAGLGLAVGLASWWWAPLAPPAEAAAARPVVAVLELVNLSRDPDADWLSTALAEMMNAELAVTRQVRTVPRELVVRTRRGLGLDGGQLDEPEAIGRLIEALGTDWALSGHFLRLGDDRGQLRIDVAVRSGAEAESLSTVSVSGPEEGLIDLVSSLGAAVRRDLGFEPLSQSEAGAARASLPATAEAARLYAEGLEHLRRSDPLSARDLLQRAVAVEPQNSLLHSALAAAWDQLGHDSEAEQAARRAHELSGSLFREERLWVEGRYREIARQWKEAEERYAVLWRSFPDNLEYGLRLVAVQVAGGRPAQGLATVERLRELPEPARRDPRISLAEAHSATGLSDLRRALLAARRAADQARERGALLTVAEARLVECGALRSLGEPEPGREACQEARQAFQVVGDRRGVAEAVSQLGAILWEEGDIAGARARFLESQRIYRQLGNRRGEAEALHRLAASLYLEGQLEQAQRRFAEARASFEEVGDLAGAAKALNNLGSVHKSRGDLAAARQDYEQSLEIKRRIGQSAGIAYTLHNLAEVQVLQGDLETAAARHEEALEILEQVGDRSARAGTLASLGLVRLQQGRAALAEAGLEEALKLSRQVGNELHAAWALFGLGELAASREQLTEAADLHREALEIRTRLGAAPAVADSRLALGRLALRSGRWQEAVAAARQVEEMHRATRSRGGQAQAATLESQALLALSRPRAALEAAERACALVAESELVEVERQAVEARAQASAAAGRG